MTTAGTHTGTVLLRALHDYYWQQQLQNSGGLSPLATLLAPMPLVAHIVLTASRLESPRMVDTMPEWFNAATLLLAPGL